MSPISVARWCPLLISNSKVPWALVRYLFKLVPFHALISLAVLCVVYAIAEHMFIQWFFGEEPYWKPFFPWSWRALFFSLFTVPVLSFVQLLWLALHHWYLARHWCRPRCGSHSRASRGYSMLPRGESNALEGEQSGSGDDEDCDVEADVYASKPPPSNPLRPSFIWSPRFVFWFALLCSSLWLGLHYQQPGDLRYLALIEKANAHPKRAGYGDQGKAEASCTTVLTN